MRVQDVMIEKANFNLNKNNYSFLLKLLDRDFINTKLKIYNSNIFYRNLDNDVLFINNIENAKYIYDQKQSKNILYSKNNIFNLPYSIEVSNNQDEKKLKNKYRSLSLQIEINFYMEGNLN